MMLLPVITILLFLNRVSYTVDGYCMSSPLQSETTAVSKRVRSFCEYKSLDGKSTVRLFPGSKIYTPDCIECSCSMRGLSCCGFGSHGGTVGLPDGCMSLHDGCRDFHVWKRNKSLDCFTGKPLDFANMAFKPHPDNFIGLDKAAKDKAATNIDTQMNTRGSLFLPISIPNARDWRDILRGVNLPPKSGLDLAKLNHTLSSMGLTKLNFPTSGIDWSKLNIPAAGLDLTKMNRPISRLDLNSLMKSIPAAGVDWSKLNLPTSGVDLSKLNIPTSGIDWSKLNIPTSGVDLAKLNIPTSGIDWSKLNVPLTGLDMAKLNRAVPGLELTKLNNPLTANDLMQQIMAKHVPTGNSVRTIKVETSSGTGKEPQTKVETFSRPLPPGLPHSWHAPMTVQPNQQANFANPWLPLLLVDHI